MRYIFGFIIIFFLQFITSCKKESEKKYCWQIVDPLGNNLNEVCDKTEAELKACAKDGTCGTFYMGTDLTSCDYYEVGGEPFCWIINNRYYNNFTENEIQRLVNCYFAGTTPSKVECNNCQNWYSREKKTYKPAGSFTYSPVTFATYCGDSANVISSNGHIITKNDDDSLIIIQFSIDGMVWR